MPSEEELRNQILEIIESRKESYGPVLVQSAISKHNEKWQNIVTKVVPLHCKEKPDPLKTLDYGNFAIVDRLISLEELVKYVKDLSAVHSTIFSFDKYEVEIPVGQFSDKHEYDSGDDFMNVGWFFNWFCFSCGGRHNRIGPLISSQLPLFVDSLDAIHDCLGVDLTSFSNYGILICLPNYGARINEVKIGPTELSISIETKEIASDDLIAKCYCKSGNMKRQEDVSFSSLQSRVFIGFRPESAYIGLLSKSKNEMLDKREIYSSWRLPKGVIIDIPEFETKQLIEQGESKTVEFKRQIEELRPGDVYEFVESIVAFANSKGGLIFLGVDNDAQIYGLSDKDDEERVRKIVRSHCIPEPKYECLRQPIGEKQIMVIRVEEGSDKPYTAWQKGVFIRAGSTDRIAERYELDEIYRSKIGGYAQPVS